MEIFQGALFKPNLPGVATTLQNRSMTPLFRAMTPFFKGHGFFEQKVQGRWSRVRDTNGKWGKQIGRVVDLFGFFFGWGLQSGVGGHKSNTLMCGLTERSRTYGI